MADEPVNTVKDPDDRTTGRETVTGAQASKRIDELQHEAGRDKNLRGTSER